MMSSSDTQTLVYQYGLRRPGEGAEIAHEQMRAAHTLYNNMIEIEHDTADARDALQLRFSPDLGPAIEEKDAKIASLGELRAQIKALKGNRGKGAEALAAHKAESKRLQAEARPLAEAVKILKERIRILRVELRDNEGYRSADAALNAERKASYQAIYDGHAVFWPLYNTVKASVDQAVKATRPWMPLRFSRWTGDGQIGGQIGTKKPSEEAIFGDHPYFQIDPVDPRAWDPAVPRGERRRLQRTTMRLRLGTVPHTRKPIWAEWPMIMHRPLPERCGVPTVTVNRRMHADSEKWTAQVTVQTQRSSTGLDRGKTIALDLGWRTLDTSEPATSARRFESRDESGEVRVFFWRDSSGATGELRLPASIQSSFDHANDIRSRRDKEQDDLRVFLLGALQDRNALPDELREHVSHLWQWRAPGRFVALWRRFGDVLPEAVRDRLRDWYHGGHDEDGNYTGDVYSGDRHRWQYETGCRRKALGHRREVWRRFAAWVAETYDYIIIERFHLPAVIKKPEPEVAPDVSDLEAMQQNRASGQRVKAAPGEARSALVSAARRRGRHVLEVPAEYTTMRCAACGHCEPWTKPAELWHTCAGCGVRFDQDANAAINILARGEAMLQVPGSLEAANPAEAPRKPKWAKRHKPKDGADDA